MSAVMDDGLAAAPMPVRKESVLALFDALGRKLARHNQVVEVAVYGGTALMLLFDAREATKDVDFVRMAGDADFLIRLADELAANHDLPEGWLNDSVSIFASDCPDHEFFGDFPRQGKPGLRVFTASPEYLFAMKCMAMRGILQTSDAQDVWDLAHVCDVKDVEHAQTIVEAYYPGKLPKRNRLILEDVFMAKAQNKRFSREYFW